MSDYPALKEYYNRDLIRRYSKDLSKAYPDFDRSDFESRVLKDLNDLSLIERAWAITEAMYSNLPKDYDKVAAIFISCFGHEEHIERIEGMNGFYFMPFGNYVSKYGLDDFETSMDLLRAITVRFTSEFPIRAFIEKHQDRTLALMHQWAEDPNVHIRRLVSEGTRPRLPWASRLRALQNDPKPILELLEKLKEDPELYVRRSVANNLNDIAKDHPDLVIQVLKDWRRSKNEGTQWIIKHASRSLVKLGNKEALALLGFDPNVRVELSELTSGENVSVGEDIEFSFVLLNRESTSVELTVDFVVHYMKANGKQAPKVFKLNKAKLEPSEKMNFKKKISFKPISTRKYYPGEHIIELQVNGRRLGSTSFELKMP